MNEYKIAHIVEQGQQMIIIPLEPKFEQTSDQQKIELKNHLQICASSAGLAGTVVLIWQFGNKIKFIAPPEWHAFFKSISWNRIIASLNKTLTCR